MEYTVLINNKEYGPVNGLTLENWVEEGRVLPDSKVKESLSGVVHQAINISFLDEAFVIQSRYFKQNSLKTNIGAGFSNALKVKPTLKQRQHESEEYINFSDRAATYTERVKAAAIDISFLLIVACLLFFGINYIVLKQVCGLNVLLYIFIAIFLFLSIMYFTFQISCSRRTLGMRIAGTTMVRRSDNSKDIFLFRAFIYTLMMIVFCILNFIFIFITGKEFVFQDLIADISVVYYNR
jgi:uncharacterized RDD family membrane protein YckC